MAMSGCKHRCQTRNVSFWYLLHFCMYLRGVCLCLAGGNASCHCRHTRAQSKQANLWTGLNKTRISSRLFNRPGSAYPHTTSITVKAELFGGFIFQHLRYKLVIPKSKHHLEFKNLEKSKSISMQRGNVEVHILKIANY